ncbi:DUF4974 domain-containing protein [uncultured Tenacibaculum sp.]|uniref:DUF4974 domain-containing protein n=1 Tax=uncultured Tenacibaculum sp. TaxID=174713 RepID=UPI002631FAF6|nr:DUF4974 domain-containing protein [uncultured Tenacibaculum sp.]
MKKVVLIIFFFSWKIAFSNANNDSIKIDLQVLEMKKNFVSSKATGEKLIQFNNFRLVDFISKITGTPIQYISNESGINPLIKFKATSSSRISKKKLIVQLQRILIEKIGLVLKYDKSQEKVKTLKKIVDKSRLVKCDDKNNREVVQIINRTFRGKCVSIKTIVNQIEKWYDIKLFVEEYGNEKYDITIHHANSVEEIIEELKFYYSIKIEEEYKEVRTINLYKNEK